MTLLWESLLLNGFWLWHEGEMMKPTSHATYTLALGMPKKGLEVGEKNVGKLYLGYLGIPEKAYEAKEYHAPDFSKNSYVSL